MHLPEDMSPAIILGLSAVGPAPPAAPTLEESGVEASSLVSILVLSSLPASLLGSVLVTFLLWVFMSPTALGAAAGLEGAVAPTAFKRSAGKSSWYIGRDVVRDKVSLILGREVTYRGGTIAHGEREGAAQGNESNQKGGGLHPGSKKNYL